MRIENIWKEFGLIQTFVQLLSMIYFVLLITTHFSKSICIVFTSLVELVLSLICNLLTQSFVHYFDNYSNNYNCPYNDISPT